MTNPEIAQRQAEIDARCAAATPGEWFHYGNGSLQDSDNNDLMEDEYNCYTVSFKRSEDAEFCANAMPDLIWQRERIKALEAERADTEAARIKNWECFAAESKCTRKARKWARRWKSLARKRFGHENYYKGRLLHYKEQLERRDNRIAALENAARSCGTCVHVKGSLDRGGICLPRSSVCQTCHDENLTSEPWEGWKRWEFAEERFAPERGGQNDI